VIPADGFYEWDREGKVKKPYRFIPKDGGYFNLAGVWDEWTAPNGKSMHSFAIITTGPNDRVGRIHDRMPVILPEESAEKWLTLPPGHEAELLSMLKAFPAERMEDYAVSPKMNSSHFKEAACIDPI